MEGEHDGVITEPLAELCMCCLEFQSYLFWTMSNRKVKISNENLFKTLEISLCSFACMLGQHELTSEKLGSDTGYSLIRTFFFTLLPLLPVQNVFMMSNRFY